MRRRSIVLVLAACLAATAAAYAVYWWIAAGEVRAGIERWAAERRQAGWTVSYGALAIRGFPTRLRARLDAPVLAAREPVAWRWRGPRLTMAVRPWERRDLVLAAPGEHRVEVAGEGGMRAFLVDAARADGTARVGDGGRVRTARADLAAIAVAPAGGAETRIEALSVTVDLASARPVVSVEAVGVAPPETLRLPLAAPVEVLSIDAVVTGALAGGPLRASLAAWRDGGGTVEVSGLTLHWPPLALAAEGTLALDGDMQPVGAMTARIEGYRETIDGLAASGLVRPSDAVAAKLVLGMLTAAPASDGRPAGRIPLSVQDRRLHVGPVPLIRLRRIDWD